MLQYSKVISFCNKASLLCYNGNLKVNKVSLFFQFLSRISYQFFTEILLKLKVADIIKLISFVDDFQNKPILGKHFNWMLLNFWLLPPWRQCKILQEKGIYRMSKKCVQRNLGEKNVAKNDLKNDYIFIFHFSLHYLFLLNLLKFSFFNFSH